VERDYGSFQCTVVLRVSGQRFEAVAGLESGVLELVLPKAERVKAREFTVESRD
jgi:HSP20 family molecular chaperone IbpA